MKHQNEQITLGKFISELYKVSTVMYTESVLKPAGIYQINP